MNKMLYNFNLPSGFSVNMFFFILPVICLLFLEILELSYNFFNIRKTESRFSYFSSYTVGISIIVILFCLGLRMYIDEEIFSYQYEQVTHHFIYGFYPHTFVFFCFLVAFYFSSWYSYIYDLLIDYFQQNYELILFFFQIFFIFFFFFFFF